MNAEAPNPPSAAPRRINLLVLPNFTLLSLGSLLEPMRMANQLAGRELYDWRLVSADGQQVVASDGVRLAVDAAIEDAPPCDLLIVAGGWDITASFTDAHLDYLRQQASQGLRLGAVCTGTYVLAAAGLMDGHPCSIHWENMASLHEQHPLVLCTNQLFTITDQRVTSSGGTAPLDMMLNLIAGEHGVSLSNAISQMFVIDRIRSDTEHQKVPLKVTTGLAPQKLMEAVGLMEANIEEPISLQELSELLGVSRRQLERLFKGNLNCSPCRYYMRVRLHRARQLLKQTTLSIIEIALLCGFVSTPHFSKCYRSHLGISPRQERRQVCAAAQSGTAHAEGAAPTSSANAVGSATRPGCRLVRTEPSFGAVALEQA